ncbi:type VII secretion protein EccB [Saccharothrix lopnurensis]|uniref:Type VII secretion protein EccB n=1 Tax=Saccharothrix lopnurensis TaxID=1670621 RepID=A0ABW1PBI5_9PSEU
MSTPFGGGAHRHLASRLSSALVTGSRWRVDSSERRLRLGLLAGALVTAAVLAALSLGVAGRATTVAAPWWHEGAFLAEGETGARYVVLDGRLRPVPNHASALLVLGRSDVSPKVVPRAELPVPGPALGIPGAPDRLPPPDQLLARSELDLARTSGIPAGRGALVRSGRAHHLVTDDGTAFPLTRGAGGDALIALGYAGTTPVEVEAGWLASFASGPTLDPARARAGL